MKKIETPRPHMNEDRVIVTEYSYYAPSNMLKSHRGPYYARAFDLVPVVGEQIGEIIYTYDAKGNLEEISYPVVTRPDATAQSLEPKIFKYNGYGLVTDIHNGQLHTQYTYYSDLMHSGFLKEIDEDKDRRGRKTQYQVDDRGRITQVRDHYGSQTDFKWTKFDTLTHVVLPEIVPGADRPLVSYKYDKNRKLIEITEEIRMHDGTAHPNGELVQKLKYDVYGRLVMRTVGSTTGWTLSFIKQYFLLPIRSVKR